MAMHGGMGSPGAWSSMRSFRKDRSVTRAQLPPGTFKRILRFAASYKRLVFFLLGLLIVSSVLGAIVPLLFRDLINKGIRGNDARIVVILAAVAAAIAVVNAALSLAERWFSARIGEGLIYDMRSKVFAHVQRMPLAFFTRTQTGALISRLNNDVIGAQQAFTSTLSNVVGNLFSVSVTLVFMFLLSWQITLVALALLPLFVLPARAMGRRLQAISRESYNLDAAMNATMTERFNVSGAMLAKLFGRPGDDDREFSGRAGRVRDIGVTQAMYSRVFFAALMLVASLATALVYGWGGYQAVTGALDVGTVVALSLYLTRLYGPLTSLSNANVDVMTALVSFDRVFEVLDLPSAIADADGAAELPRDLDGQASLAFEAVDFRYPTPAETSLASLESVAVLDATPERQVLHGVSFHAEPGEMIAVVGPSGAGKTTISQLVTRMYDVQGGAVRIGGHDVRDVTLQSLRDAVGVVTQDAHLFHDTVRANLAYAAPNATEHAMWAAVDGAQIGGLIRSLPDGLDTLVGDRGYRLSGGEKQRLAIARVLLKEPAIVVLDEATAHLDSESEIAVQRALKTALAGRTSLVIAHRLSTVREADSILVVDDGRVVERGSHDELVAAGGLYAELHATQVDRQTEADVESAFSAVLGD
jgi:ATP-binding cassette subfamily B protein